MPIHHQLNINGEEILAMTETYHEHKGELVRLDSLVVFNLQGAQIKRFDLGPHSNIWPHYIDKEPWEQPSTVIRNLTTHKELSHFNSFYKIEKNNSPIPAFVEGNYIVNDIFSNRVYILDENLNSVIWGYHFSHEKRGRNRTHDVQVLPSGRLLVYVNGGSDSPYSSLVELDPVTKERFLLFKEEPVEKFYAQRAGGVQKISPSRLLFSDITNGSQFHVVDLTTKKKVRTVTLDGLVPREPQDLQQVKQRDLSLFLKNNKGI